MTGAKTHNITCSTEAGPAGEQIYGSIPLRDYTETHANGDKLNSVRQDRGTRRCACWRSRPSRRDRLCARPG